MESYRQFTRDLGTWYGMLCRNKKTGNPEELLDKNYESIETRLLTNPRALLLANYHKKLPIKDTKYKFDFFTYACGGNFSEEYRNEFKEN